MFELSKLRFQMNSAIRKKRGTDGPRTDGPTDRPSYRDAWTHLKTGTWELRSSFWMGIFFSNGQSNRQKKQFLKIF